MEGYSLGEATITVNAGEEITHTFTLKKSLDINALGRCQLFPILSKIFERILNILT